MKIKAVCELTGLSDRTIRYYIEEELIHPVCTENYLGRKTFSFSDNNVTELNQIAVLRRFGFSIDEIKQMQAESFESLRIIKALKEKKHASVETELSALTALNKLDTWRSYTIDELCRILTAPPEDPTPARPSGLECCLKYMGRIIKAFLFWSVTLLPVGLVLFGILCGARNFHYTTFNRQNLVCLILALIPTLSILIVSTWQRRSTKRTATHVIVFLSILYLPLSLLFSLGIVGPSETTNILDYRHLDTTCTANTDPVYQELFPAMPHRYTLTQDANGKWQEYDAYACYYYHMISWDCYDIYAEWSVSTADFTQEVQRVRDLFLHAEYYTYSEQSRGNYQCFILYSGREPFAESTTESRSVCYIFAYDPSSLRLRYIVYHNDYETDDLPYYLSLPW